METHNNATCNCPYHAWHERYLKAQGLKWRDNTASGHKIGKAPKLIPPWIKIRNNRREHKETLDDMIFLLDKNGNGE